MDLYCSFTPPAVYLIHHSVLNRKELNINKFLISDFSVTFHIYCSAWPFDMHARPHQHSGTGTHAHAHAHTTHTHTLTHSGTHARLDFEALRPSCPSFQTLSRQEKNLGHQLSSLNLSITVTLDQWCRTHPSSPAGPRWTGLAQSSPSYRCQESQLTACCCSWFQFVGPAMGRCQQSVLWQWVAVW